MEVNKDFDLVARVLTRPLLLKVTRALALVAFCFSSSMSAQDVDPAAAKASKMRERITDAELAKIRAASPSSFDKSKAKPIEKPEVTVKRDIYQISDVLVDGGFHTVIPKGAVLSVPESLTNRIASKAEGKFQFWPEFYERNKAWIRLQEVEVDVALGKVPLPESVVKMLGTESKMVIASFKGNPITVLEAPADKDADVKTEAKK